MYVAGKKRCFSARPLERSVSYLRCSQICGVVGGRICSGLDSAVHVHHGPVVYDDAAAEVILGRMPHHSRALAAHFFKRGAFKDQREYRFVLYGVGGRPLQDEIYLRITPDLRRVFERAQ